MELGPGTRQNLNAQRCTWSSIGFSVFSLCLYVLGFYKNPTVNKYSYFYGSHCLLRRVFLPATPFYQAASHIVGWPAQAIFTEAFTGKIIKGEVILALKCGNTLSVKVCLKVCMCLLLSGSENDSFPLSQSSCSLIFWSFFFTVRRVGGCGGEHALYSPL